MGLPDRSPTELQGRRVLVTGASAGIGAATARAFAARGSDLVLLARREERLRALADELVSAHGVSVEVHGLDITDHAAVKRLAAKGAFKDIDILVNNAGLAKGVDPIHEADPDDWETMLATNVLGLLYMTRQIVPGMVQRGDGHIVNLGSVAGRWVYKGGAVYCATKHAVAALSEGLRMDLIGKGVRVTNIEPGLVETEFSIVRLGDKEKAARVYADTVPLVAEDIADTIVWSVDRPRHVNIQEIVIFPTDQAAITQVHRYETEER
jgi:3-hydroxy acid dehydrogenase / malonic semialdehyde reductase